MALQLVPFANAVTFSRGTGATRVNAAGLIVGVDFSSTSNTITTGSKTFTLAADANVNRDWAVNSSVIAVSQAGATGSMTGVVTSYTPSTQSLVINVTSVTGSGTSTDWRIGSLEMREDYDPVTLVRKGVLSEVSATNVFGNSERAEWGAGNVGIQSATNNSILFSPTGSVRGILIVESAANTNHRLSNNFTSVAGLAYTMSAWFKAKERVDAVINAGASQATFNLSGTGSVTSTSANCQASISQFTDGWYLCSFTFTGTGVSFSTGFGIAIGVNNTYTGDGVSGLYVCGMSYVTANALTSYIPTTTAQVTRNADNFPLTAAAVASIRQGEGTLYAEITCDDTGVAQKRALRLSGTNADIRIGKQGTGTLSNFTKMSEGAGLRLMGTANSLIRGNGQELLPITFMDARIATPLTTLENANAIAFNGSNRFAGVSFNEEFFTDAITYTPVGVRATLAGAHYNGNRFIIACSSLSGTVILSDGTSFRRVNTPVITQPTNEITSGLVGGTLRNVIVGNGGFIATSDDDGETWTARTSGTSLSINAITYTGTRFVAQTTGGVRPVIYSDNGITWVTGQSNLGNGDIHAANSLVVTVGLNGDVFVSSDNGVNFTRATNTNTTQTLNGVTYSPTLNLWVAVGNGGTIITATDPAGTWTVQTSGTTQQLLEAAIFNNAIYIVGGAQTLLTSTNGTTYTSLTAGVTSTLFGIAASPTTLLITGANGAIASSPDGTTFTSRSSNAQALNGIAFGNSTFVSVGNAANGSGYIATIGADGTVTRRVSGTTAGISSIKFLNGGFIANQESQTTGLKSSDGITWTTVNYTTSNNSSAFGNGIYVTNRGALLSGATVFMMSADNTTYSQQSFSLGGTLLVDIEFANNLFVAVGTGGGIVTITNSGTTLTPVRRTSNTTQNLNSVMFSTRDQLWYAAGNGGVLLYSPDAITWTAVQNSGTASILGTTLQSNQPLPQFKSGVNKIALSYKQNQVIAALNGVASTSDTAATIPTITAASIAENLNGYIKRIQIFPNASTAEELAAKTT